MVGHCFSRSAAGKRISYETKGRKTSSSVLDLRLRPKQYSLTKRGQKSDLWHFLVLLTVGLSVLWG
jgi:hypothetical protein